MGALETCKFDLNCDNYIEVYKENIEIENKNPKIVNQLNIIKTNRSHPIKEIHPKIYHNYKGTSKFFKNSFQKIQNDYENKDRIAVSKTDDIIFYKDESIDNSSKTKKNLNENDVFLKRNQKFKYEEEDDYIDLKQSMEISIKYEDNTGNSQQSQFNIKEDALIGSILLNSKHNVDDLNDNSSFQNIKNNNLILDKNNQIEDLLILDKSNNLCNPSNLDNKIDLKNTDKLIDSFSNNKIYLNENQSKNLKSSTKIIEDRYNFKSHSRNNKREEKVTYKFGSLTKDESWRRLNIEFFIPEEKLIEAEDNDIIFQSDLGFVKLPEFNRVIKPFTIKFAMITKNEFNEDKFELKSLNNSEAFKTVNSRVVNINEEHKRIKGRKMNVIKELKTENLISEKNDMVPNYKSSFNSEDFIDLNNTLIFASLNKELIDKWVCVINHFIKK